MSSVVAGRLPTACDAGRGSRLIVIPSGVPPTHGLDSSCVGAWMPPLTESYGIRQGRRCGKSMKERQEERSTRLIDGSADFQKMMDRRRTH